jgi:membrane-associated phospholipid phosphatase
LDRGQELGDKLHLSHSSNQKTIFQLSVPIGDKHLNFPFNIPYDANTMMYFLGDGITHFSIAGGFWAYGAIKDDSRARQTASQLAESILTTGICVQILKHVTGRESPYASTAPGGIWRFFPNQVEYANNVPHFDAFPSGHLATAMATVTVIAENYPEYRFIKPVGYSLMGLLSFAMVNNGVHWISDYPLALAMGYTFAKIAVVKGRTKVQKSNEDYEDDGIYEGKKIELTPVFYGENTLGIGMRLRF